MTIHIRTMTPEDYEATIDLWHRSAGVALSSADRPEAIGRYLDRNPGLSLVVEDSGRVVAALLCGHDGRRGYLHHLAVDPGHRGRGIGRRLVERATDGLRAEGIAKCHIFVMRDNPSGIAFWTHLGWSPRDDIGIVSLGLEDSPATAPATPSGEKVE
jgi:ribosomal protein S18 acetylase RimI-like enzyme